MPPFLGRDELRDNARRQEVMAPLPGHSTVRRGPLTLITPVSVGLIRD